MTGTNALNGGNLDAHFDSAQNYYGVLSNQLSVEPANANAAIQWGGLFFTCNDNSGRYVANVNSVLFASATWYSVAPNCASGATWVINVIGNGDLVFQGGDFPGVGERVLYNVIGNGRTIRVKTRVNGNILATGSTLVQEGGVTAGLVVVGSISNMLSAALPKCDDLKPYAIVLPLQAAAESGATVMSVAGFSQFVSQDQFTIGSSSIVYTLQTRSQSADGTSFTITFSPPLSDSAENGVFIKTSVDPNLPRVQDNITVEEATGSSAFTLAASFVVIFISLLF
jgi:hypothetical protein